MSKWNSVTNKLPKNDKYVLIFVENSEYPEFSQVDIGTYQNEKWYCRGGIDKHEKIIRWTKIPKY